MNCETTVQVWDVTPAPHQVLLGTVTFGCLLAWLHWLLLQKYWIVGNIEGSLFFWSWQI